jgi:DnaJ-class molecular chaperone
MPSLHGRRSGDVRVVVSVHVPEHLAEAQRSALESMVDDLPDAAERQPGLFDRIRRAVSGSVNGH